MDTFRMAVVEAVEGKSDIGIVLAAVAVAARVAAKEKHIDMRWAAEAAEVSDYEKPAKEGFVRYDKHSWGTAGEAEEGRNPAAEADRRRAGKTGYMNIAAKVGLTAWEGPGWDTLKALRCQICSKKRKGPTVVVV